MSKLTIKNINGEEVGVISAEFNVGKIYEEREGFILAGMYTGSMSKFYKDLIYQKANEGNIDGFEEMLEQYVTIEILNKIGVERHPLENKNGKILGLKEDVEVEIVEQ